MMVYWTSLPALYVMCQGKIDVKKYVDKAEPDEPAQSDQRATLSADKSIYYYFTYEGTVYMQLSDEDCKCAC